MPLFDDEEMPTKRKPLDDGLDKRKKKEKEPEARAKKKLKQNAKHALRPEKMFFKEDERQMYAEYFNRFKHDIEERYEEFSTAQEILVDCLCYAIIRLERKSRLESFFGRFFDRVAPHDPLGQITATLKALGLLPEKKESKEIGSAGEIKKIIANDALGADGNTSTSMTHEEWIKTVRDTDMPKIEMRTPEIIPTYTETDLVFSDDEDDEEET